MNAIATINTLTMSSREIAELTEKRHRDVIRDIRVMTEALGDGANLRHLKETKDSRGYTEEFFLPKDLTLTLVSGYNVKLRKRIIDRWLELKERVAKPTLNPANLSRLQLIEIAMQAEQERIQLEGKVEQMTPKVEGFDRLATISKGSFCIRDAAKNLQIQEKDLRRLLVEKEWIYQRPMGSGWLAYSDKLKSGLMEHKVTTGEKSDGSEWTSTQARITVKGLTSLALILGTAEGVLLPQVKPVASMVLQ